MTTLTKFSTIAKKIEKGDAVKPDLILMDIILKGVESIEAAERIRDHFDIPVIYFTAYRDEERRERTKVTEPFGGDKCKCT